jgi:hypothetical protein
MTRARVAAALLAVAVSAVVAAAQGGAPAKMKTVDTKLGFTVDVPETWTVGTPAENNKFEVGNSDEDFALVVTDFGPVPSDLAAADAIYKEGFASSGFTLKSASDATVAGTSVKRYVFSIAADSGEGHVEVVMLPVGGEMYSVLVATPAASLASRQAVIAKLFDSIRMAGAK